MLGVWSILGRHLAYDKMHGRFAWDTVIVKDVLSELEQWLSGINNEPVYELEQWLSDMINKPVY